jgi:hypothetical protein
MTGEKVEYFTSPKALRRHTIITKKFCSKYAAKEDGFLKALLRETF